MDSKNNPYPTPMAPPTHGATVPTAAIGTPIPTMAAPAPAPYPASGTPMYTTPTYAPATTYAQATTYAPAPMYAQTYAPAPAPAPVYTAYTTPATVITPTVAGTTFHTTTTGYNVIVAPEYAGHTPPAYPSASTIKTYDGQIATIVGYPGCK